jgi:hypothetical protein
MEEKERPTIEHPLTETGVKAESTHHGLRSRVGQHRTDLEHQPLDPVIVAGPWIAAAGTVYAGARSVAKSLAHAGSNGQLPVH